MIKPFFINLILLSSFLIFFIVLQKISAASQEVILNSITEEKHQFVLYGDQGKNASLILRESKQKKHKKNNFEIEWGAEFFYPYNSSDLQKIYIWEHNLDWIWETTESEIIGSSSIESCPVSLKYFVDGEKFKTEISFTNTNQNTIKNLTLKLRVNYPTSIIIVNETNKSSKEKTLPIEISADNSAYIDVANEEKIISIYEGNERSEIEYLINMGDVIPGEKIFKVIQLSKKNKI